jgi:hypothetical protein
MSRNIASSSCCDNVVKLADLAGRTIEFRRYGKLAPHIGVRWDCPSCDTAYFVIWKRYDKFWDRPEESQKDQLLDYSGQPYYNDYKGKFASLEDGKLTDTGAFSLVLSYYDQLYEGDQWQKCEDADDAQWVWYFTNYCP